MVWLGKSANVHWWNQWVPVYTGKYRVWHMFTAVTHFSIHLDLISSLSSSYGREIQAVTFLSLSLYIWTGFETWLQRPRVSSIISERGECHVKWAAHSTPSRSDAARAAARTGVFLKLLMVSQTQVVGLHFIWTGLEGEGGGRQTEESAPLFSFEVTYCCLVIGTSLPLLSFIVFFFPWRPSLVEQDLQISKLFSDLALFFKAASKRFSDLFPLQ